SKIHAARSLSEIAIDLTETGTLKTSKLANMGSKGKIISGSSGSLLSSGQCVCLGEN
ncbi:FERM domain-containing protein 4A, partial [Xenoophorus captivus]